MKYTAQDIIKMATQAEVAALEGYFGPHWVYRALKDEEEQPRYGLKYEASTTELRAPKNAARKAWEQIKSDIDRMAAIGLPNVELTKDAAQSSWLPTPEELDEPNCPCTGPNHAPDCIHYRHS